MNRNESFIILKTFDLCSGLRQKKKKEKRIRTIFHRLHKIISHIIKKTLPLRFSFKFNSPYSLKRELSEIKNKSKQTKKQTQDSIFSYFEF